MQPVDNMAMVDNMPPVDNKPPVDNMPHVNLPTLQSATCSDLPLVKNFTFNECNTTNLCRRSRIFGGMIVWVAYFSGRVDIGDKM
jgi:hypothetical protein